MRRRRRERESEEEKKKEEEAVVPVDPFNERVVLAAVMVSKEAADQLLTTIQADHFHARGHARTWEVLREMQRRGLYYDSQTVLQMSGGEVDVAYLDELVKERAERPPNLRHHVDALRWDKARIDAARGPLSAFLASMRDVTSPPDKVRSLARQLADSFVGHGSDAYLESAHDIVRRHAKVLEDRQSGMACYPFGIRDLDVYPDGPNAGEPRMVPGTAPGKITVFTGVSGSGKSTVAARVILELARMRRRLLVGAWEMGSGVTLELIAAISLGFFRTDVSKGYYDDDQRRALLEEMERLGEFIRFFNLPFGRARAERGASANDRQLDLVAQVIADSKAEVFVADLMRRAMKETKPDDEEQFLFRLQYEGERLGVHQLWLHQVKIKDVEVRRDRRPTREAMKGSSAWVEVPDTIIGFHREYLWKDVEDNRLEAIIMKMRYGPWPQAVEFEWDPDRVTLINGRESDYARPGEDSEVDAFLSERGRPGRRGRH